MKTLMDKTLRDMFISLDNIYSIMSENFFACMFKWKHPKTSIAFLCIGRTEMKLNCDNLTALILRTFLHIQEKKKDEKKNFSWKPKFLGRYHCSNQATLIYPVELLDLAKG